MKSRSGPPPMIAIDRDGTLIHECEYLNDPGQIRFLRGVYGGLKRLRRAGFRVVVVSNQAGVGRGLISPAQLAKVNERFLKLLKSHHAPIDGYYWCPHAPSAGCTCRKPRTGMLKMASKKLRYPWKGAISIGDRPTDVELGQRAGGRGVLVQTGYGRRWARSPEAQKADFIAKNFNEAVSWILRQGGAAE